MVWLPITFAEKGRIVMAAMSLDPRNLLSGKHGVAAAVPPTVYLLLLLAGGTWVYLSSSSDRLGSRGIPFRNMGKLCEQAAPILAMPAVDYVSSCAENEQAAETQLIRNWKRYPVPIRTACISELDDAAPSYIELLTCLDLKGSELATGH